MDRAHKGEAARKWELVGETAILPSFTAILHILFFERLTGLGHCLEGGAHPLLPLLDPTCQPKAADGVGVGHTW